MLNDVKGFIRMFAAIVTVVANLMMLFQIYNKKPITPLLEELSFVSIVVLLLLR
ncbi:hypothetical protein [Schleiferilactobacillus perolens]|uniref:hypothetical protein n=1 Tax=Schleiferilactobacillus perolens TaxID=100468 RepID=UPI002353226E|nr:hypothetical protein [Schleiferilactobacillus perolens]MCI1893063.1 hypothetical protein [Schleiferilactobacillus harbinensis]MCI1913120.1 hypothetical protein [Schleiferilactobacillus harbinensis]MCI2171089.1 hypothetical protein [Schleiferilactobacillus perolens]